MTIRGYKIRPRWRRITLAIGLTLYSTVGAQAVGSWARFYLGINFEEPFILFGYDVTSWIIGFDILFGVPLALLFLGFLAFAVGSALLDVEKTGT